jgi:hypothetical protein
MGSVKMKRFICIVIVLLLYGSGDAATSREFVPMREYVDILLREHEKHQEIQLKAYSDALILSRAELERRLEGLNELRQDVVKDRAQFVRAETFDERKKYTDSLLQELRDRLLSLETKLFAWTTAIGAFFMLVQIGMNLWRKTRAAGRERSTDLFPPFPNQSCGIRYRKSKRRGD